MLNLYAQICFLCVYAHISNISVYILDKYTCTLRHIMFIFTLMSIDLIHEEWDCTLEGRSQDMYLSIFLCEYNGKINFRMCIKSRAAISQPAASTLKIRNVNPADPKTPHNPKACLHVHIISFICPGYEPEGVLEAMACAVASLGIAADDDHEVLKCSNGQLVRGDFVCLNQHDTSTGARQLKLLGRPMLCDFDSLWVRKDLQSIPALQLLALLCHSTEDLGLQQTMLELHAGRWGMLQPRHLQLWLRLAVLLPLIANEGGSGHEDFLALHNQVHLVTLDTIDLRHGLAALHLRANSEAHRSQDFGCVCQLTFVVVFSHDSVVGWLLGRRLLLSLSLAPLAWRRQCHANFF